MSAPPLRRIGIFGGTFDPPHVGHLVTAVDVAHALRLDELQLVVAGEPWQKVGTRALTPAHDRLAMVQAAVSAVPALVASAIEVERAGPSYTADTLREVTAQHPEAELFLVLGADAAAGLPTWERVGEVQELATVVVVSRPGSGPVSPLPGWRWETLEVPRLDVSSTDLRARVLDGRPLNYLLPRAVLDCIATRGLYEVPPTLAPTERGTDSPTHVRTLHDR